VSAKGPTQRHTWAMATKMAGRLVRRGAVAIALVLFAGCQPGALEEPADHEEVGLPADSTDYPVNTPDLIDDPPDPIDYHGRH
jgi:hypothetical protein